MGEQIVFLVLYKKSGYTELKECENKDEAVGAAVRLKGYVIEPIYPTKEVE